MSAWAPVRDRRVRASEDAMKVVVDMSACDLHGLCVETAPEVFEIGNDGVLKVLNETPGEDLRAKVEKAVRECPTAVPTGHPRCTAGGAGGPYCGGSASHIPIR